MNDLVPLIAVVAATAILSALATAVFRMFAWGRLLEAWQEDRRAS